MRETRLETVIEQVKRGRSGDKKPWIYDKNGEIKSSVIVGPKQAYYKPKSNDRFGIIQKKPYLSSKTNLFVLQTRLVWRANKASFDLYCFMPVLQLRNGLICRVLHYIVSSIPSDSQNLRASLFFISSV